MIESRENKKYRFASMNNIEPGNKKINLIIEFLMKNFYNYSHDK